MGKICTITFKNGYAKNAPTFTIELKEILSGAWSC